MRLVCLQENSVVDGDRAIRLKRLYFRSAHRGSKETDLILGPFAKARLPEMDDAALDEFETFLEENDNDIWDWVSGKSFPADNKYDALIGLLRKNYELPG
jgi:antitoxin CptB